MRLGWQFDTVDFYAGLYRIDAEDLIEKRRIADDIETFGNVQDAASLDALAAARADS